MISSFEELKRIHQCFEKGTLEQKKACLSDALNYGSLGLNLILKVFKHNSGELMWEAYKILKNIQGSETKKNLLSYNPYRFFECIKILGEKNDVSLMEVEKVLIGKDEKIAIGSYHNTTVKVWNWESEQELNRFTVHPESVRSIVMAPDDRSIVFLGYHPNFNNRTIRFYDIYNGKKKYRPLKYNNYVNNFLFSSDGKILIISSQIKIALCDINTGQTFFTFEEESLPYVLATGINSQFPLLVSRAWGSELKVWNLNTKQLLHTLHGHLDDVKCAVISPDGKILVSGSLDKTVKIWDLESGTDLYTINKHSDQVTSVAFSPDGQTFASASWDKTIRIWDLDSGEELCLLQDLDSVTSIAFSPSGKIIISGSYDGTVKVWGVNMDDS